MAQCHRVQDLSPGSTMTGPWRTISQDLPLLEDLVVQSEGQFHSLFTPFVSFGSSRVESDKSRQAPLRASSHCSSEQGYRTGVRYGGQESDGGECQPKPVIRTYERKKKGLKDKNKVLNNNCEIKSEPITRIDIDVKGVKEEILIDDSDVSNPKLARLDENTEVCTICEKTLYGKDNFKKHLKECMEANLPVLRTNEEVLKKCRGSLACDDGDFEMKEELSFDDDLDDSESNDDEQVDARKLYPRRQIGNGNDHLDLEEKTMENGDERFPEKVIKSIEIMEKSCFGNQTSKELANKLRIPSFVIECTNCEKTFSSKKDFARHMYAHTFVKRTQGEEPVICSNCGKEFRNKTIWETHSNRTGCCGIPKTIFPCAVCKKTFTRKDNLREHLKGHAGFRTRKRKSHRCRKCGKVFSGEGMLNIHKKLHEKKENYTKSLETVERKSGKDFKCPDCGKFFNREQRLVLHNLYVHHGLKPYPCTCCGKRYCRKEDLNRHILVAHSSYPGSEEHVQKICIQSSLENEKKKHK